MHDSLSTSYQDDYNYTFRLNLAANQLLLYSRGLGQRERQRDRVKSVTRALTDQQCARRSPQC